MTTPPIPTPFPDPPDRRPWRETGARIARTVRIVLLTLVAVAVVLLVSALAAIYTGAPDVAATARRGALTEWALNTLQQRSVRARADTVTGRPPSDSASLEQGFALFHALCVECHGAPGFDRSPVGQGLSPLPPRLEETAHRWSDAELFWITRNGIRPGAMPAFGPSHGDAEIWAIVAFVRRIEWMTEEEYAERVRAPRSASDQSVQDSR